jgi:hypothetical protein
MNGEVPPPYDPSAPTAALGGSDETMGLLQWIIPSGNPVQDWNRAEHESGHAKAAKNATGNRFYDELVQQLEDIQRLDEFLDECECKGL